MHKEIKAITEVQKETEKEVKLGPVGTVLIGAYLVLLSVFLLYGLVQFWPVATTSGAPLVGRTLSDETRLFLIVAVAGALGGVVHALRSLYYWVGTRKLVRNWLAMYILLPFVGTTLAVIFYLVIRGGFFSTRATVREVSPFGFAALAGLVGLFSEQAVEKLKQVAENLLARPQKREEAKPQEEGEGEDT